MSNMFDARGACVPIPGTVRGVAYYQGRNSVLHITKDIPAS
jgi:hypothetical protein